MTKRPITDKEFQQLAIEHGRKKGWLPSSASPACSTADQALEWLIDDLDLATARCYLLLPECPQVVRDKICKIKRLRPDRL